MDPSNVSLRPYLGCIARRLRLRDGWRLAQRSLWGRWPSSGCGRWRRWRSGWSL